jgi:hypothetical protein
VLSCESTTTGVRQGNCDRCEGYLEERGPVADVVPDSSTPLFVTTLLDGRNRPNYDPAAAAGYPDRVRTTFATEGAMPLFSPTSARRLISATVLFLAWSSEAISSPSFSLTDLGFGSQSGSIVYSTDSSGNGIVIAYGATSYPFPQTPAGTLTPTQIASSGLPLYDPLPVVSNNQVPFSTITTAVQNANGIVAATDVTSADTLNGANPATNQVFSQTAYYVQKNADGSWSQPSLLWSGTATQYVPYYGALGNSIWGINKQNDVIGIMQTGSGSTATDSGVVYDINTKNLTNLSSLPSVVASGFVAVTPFAIDDDGRILALAVNPSSGQHMILLTPDGVDSPATIVPVPEPGRLAVLVLTASFYTMRRRHNRRRGILASELPINPLRQDRSLSIIKKTPPD